MCVCVFCTLESTTSRSTPRLPLVSFDLHIFKCKKWSKFPKQKEEEEDEERSICMIRLRDLFPSLALELPSFVSFFTAFVDFCNCTPQELDTIVSFSLFAGSYLVFEDDNPLRFIRIPICANIFFHTRLAQLVTVKRLNNLDTHSKQLLGFTVDNA